MSVVRDFGEYVKKGVVKNQTVDVLRSDSLRRESENGYDSLMKYVERLGIDDKNSNMIIKMAYDVIMELIRARMLLDGFNSSGYGAHEAEVSYLRKLGFIEADVEFVDRLRYFRNGIIYYGKVFDKEYIEKVLGFLKKVRKIFG